MQRRSAKTQRPDKRVDALREAPSWDDLRYLLAASRHASLAATAQALRVDQTTVGRRIQALEARLGARLLERGASGSSLTVEGQRACAIARGMESAALALETDDVRGPHGQLEGSVRIATAGGFVPVLAPALASLRAKHPRLTFEILVNTQMVNLMKHEADVAIRMTRDSQPSLVSKRLGSFSWGLFASDAYLRRRGAPKTLDGHDVIGFVAPLTHTPGGLWLAQNAQSANVVLRVDNIDSALACAADGMGLAASPSYIAARDARLGRAISDRLGRSDVFLVTRRDLTRVPRVRATIDALAEILRAKISSSDRSA